MHPSHAGRADRTTLVARLVLFLKLRRYERGKHGPSERDPACRRDLLRAGATCIDADKSIAADDRLFDTATAHCTKNGVAIRAVSVLLFG